MEALVAVNLVAPMHLCKLLLPGMQAQKASCPALPAAPRPSQARSGQALRAQAGLVLFVGSISGVRPTPGGVLPLYGATKHGLRGYAANLLEVCLALGGPEQAAWRPRLRGSGQVRLQIVSPDGIKVMHIAPSFVATDMTTSIFPDPSILIQAPDIAEAALLPIRMSKNALPFEIVITRPSKRAG